VSKPLHAVAILWVVMSLTYPFGWDQGLFAWVGRAIVEGGLPYRDAWDFKGPLTYYAFALVQWLFGVHLWSIRLLDAVLLVASFLAVRRATTVLTDHATARWAGLLYVLWYASHSYWHTAQPDGWTGMLLIMALAPIISSRGQGGWPTMAFAGVCIGLVTLFKPPSAIFLLVPLSHLAATAQSQRLTRAAAVIAGWALPIAVTAGWFALEGALDDLIAVHLRYSALYVSLSPGAGLRDLVEYLLSSRVVAVALPIVVFGEIVLWRADRPAAIALGCWALLVIALVALQNRFYAYQWLPMLPAWTLLGAAALHHIRSRVPTLAAITAGVILLHCLAPIVLEEARFVSWLVGRIDRTAYYDAYGEPGKDMRAVRWLREQGEAGPVFVFGWHSAVAWLSERETVSRFGYSLPLMLGQDLAIRAQYRAEAISALNATPPRYILVGTQSEQILGIQVTVDDFPELAAFIRQSYREAIRFGSLTVYQRSR
jgi:4-amino-4-deoxy-L-arabinose transferase-like glycosyltransferase